MRLLEHLEQGTPEWLAWRRSRRMASLAPAVMDASPYQKPRHVVAYYRNGKSQAQTPAMAHGHQYEPQARAYAAGILGELLTPICAENGDYGASLDGLTDDGKVIVETKCPYRGKESPIWENMARYQSPGGYVWQIQHQLMVTGAERCLYVVWCGEGLADALHLWVSPDADKQAQLRAAWDALWADFVAGKGAERDDEAWLAAVARYRAARVAADAATDALETARASLVDITTSSCETGGGLRVQRVERRGNIDYAKVPQLAGVDLDPYRKAGSVSWRVDELA